LTKRLWILLAALVSLLAILAGTLWSQRMPADSDSAGARPATTAPAIGALPVPTPLSPKSDGVDSLLPPWAAAGSSATTGSALTGGATALSVPTGPSIIQPPPGDAQATEKLAERLAELQQSGAQADPKKIAETLAALKQQHGAMVGGVNLDLVMNNLQVSQDIQALALEMQRESAKSGSVNSKKMQAYLSQLQNLQSQLRLDISTPPGARPPVPKVSP
jgi:hypothetical protein